MARIQGVVMIHLGELARPIELETEQRRVQCQVLHIRNKER